MACFMSLLHVFQSVLAFDAFRRGRAGLPVLAIVIGTHVAASLISLFNTEGGHCAVALLGELVVCVAAALACWYVVKKRYVQAAAR